MRVAVTVTNDRGGLRLRSVSLRTLWVAILTAFWAALLVGIIGTYSPLNWTWTGFRDNGNLWSWLQLLSAPVFIAALPLVVKETQRRSRGTSPDEADTDALAEAEQQRQVDAFQTYIVDLMLNQNLGSGGSGQSVREVARARTLAALRRVGGGRKGEVLQFVYQAGLIRREEAVLDLLDADLSGADLSGVILRGSDLTGIDLSGANLTGTDLSGACLTKVKLNEANLAEADLSGACLEGASYADEQLIAARCWP